MQQFKISEEGYKKIRRRGLRVLIPFIAVVVVVIIVISVATPHKGELQTWPVVLPILLLIYGWAFMRSLRRQRQLLLSYTVTISDHEITREQLNTPTLSINFMEIKEIIRLKKGNIVVLGLTRNDTIHIPYWIENYPVLEKELQRFAPITERPRVLPYALYRLLISVFALAMLLTVAVVENRVLVIACAVLASASFIWTSYEMRVSKNLPDNLKRISWIYLLLVLVTA
jgi:hypothetical protein